MCGCEIIHDSIFCVKCFSKVTFIDYPFCKICGKMLESSYGNSNDDFLCDTCQTYPRYFDKARALFQYDDVSKNVVMKIKNHADNFVAHLCAVMMFSKYKDLFRQADCLVPVPSHWSRFLKRGFNPADIIAIEFSKISNLPIFKILKRAKKTDYQKGKNIDERFNNVKNAFSCSNVIGIPSDPYVRLSDSPPIVFVYSIKAFASSVVASLITIFSIVFSMNLSPLIIPANPAGLLPCAFENRSLTTRRSPDIQRYYTSIKTSCKEKSCLMDPSF